MATVQLQASPPVSRGMIVFFPTYARRTPTGWSADVAGMVARPLPEHSRRRTLAMAVMKRLLDLDDTQSASDIFRARAELFLFQRVAGHPVRVVFGDREIDVGLSDKAGHFSASIEFDHASVERFARNSVRGGRWLEYEGMPVAGADVDDARATATGVIHLVDDVGTSVISDIDDTVKFSNVADRRELLRNTLVRDFVPVVGMPEAYQRWQDTGVAFHYVSSSPWQMSDCLSHFLGDVGLPAGSMHLKLFRLKDSTPLRRIPTRTRGKKRVIDRIMADFPARRFWLVGDSGERDPEIYATIARRRPEQVAGVLIREVPAKASRAKVRERLAKLASRLPQGGLTVFQTPEELAEAVGVG